MYTPLPLDEAEAAKNKATLKQRNKKQTSQQNSTIKKKVFRPVSTSQIPHVPVDLTEIDAMEVAITPEVCSDTLKFVESADVASSSRHVPTTNPISHFPNHVTSSNCQPIHASIFSSSSFNSHEPPLRPSLKRSCSSPILSPPSISTSNPFSQPQNQLSDPSTLNKPTLFSLPLSTLPSV